MLALFPEGFEEIRRRDGGLDLCAYTDAAGEERARRSFARVRSEPVAPGWEETWRRFHRPVQVGPLWVGPPWERADAGVRAVVIDPGRAFGTGAHPTTRLCLEVLLGLERGSLVDLGCGSGVLAISAAKLGFAPVVAVDADEAAVQTARANARANGVVVEVVRADVLADPIPAADVAVANIAPAVVERLAVRTPAALLVTSGYVVSERLRLTGWRHKVRREADGWAVDLYEREAGALD